MNKRKILILGVTGMLGHTLFTRLSTKKNLAVYGTARSSNGLDRWFPSELLNHIQSDVHAENLDTLIHTCASVRPDVVINCIGLVKQLPQGSNPIAAININALFPHRLAQLCQAIGSRLIHISTDCVFSGRKGYYSESDVADAEDLYGKTKLLGEVSDDGCLTVRTSIIGRELKTSHGLLEWFFNQEGQTIRGYKRAIFSGFTTHALAEIIAQIITEHPAMQGVWHVASEPISKFDLLSLVKQRYRLDIQIEPDETVVIDRSLNADRFRCTCKIVTPSWPEMVEQMYQEATPDSEPRRYHANQ